MRLVAKVAVVDAKNGSVSPSTTMGGLIVPFQNVAIQSTLSEPTDAVNVQEGDTVRKGEVLARLDTADLEANLRSDLGTAASDKAKADQTYDQAGLTIVQNRNTTNSATAALRQAQQTLATDRLNLGRDQALLHSGYISQQQFDTQNTLVHNDEQAVKTAGVGVANANTQVAANGTTSTGLQGATVAAARADEQTALGAADQVRTMIAKATIVSPVDGVIVNRNLNPGEYPGTRQIFTIQEVDRVYVVLNGAGSQVVGVQNGAAVHVLSTDNALLKQDATVVGVLNEVNPGSTNFVVKGVLDNRARRWKPGMVVSGRVTKPSVAGVVVPETAFLDDSHSTIQTIKDGTVQTVHVTMKGTDGKLAVVQGLPLNTQIIQNGQLGLNDGQSASAQRVAER